MFGLDDTPSESPLSAGLPVPLASKCLLPSNRFSPERERNPESESELSPPIWEIIWETISSASRRMLSSAVSSSGSSAAPNLGSGSGSGSGSDSGSGSGPGSGSGFGFVFD